MFRKEAGGVTTEVTGKPRLEEKRMHPPDEDRVRGHSWLSKQHEQNPTGEKQRGVLISSSQGSSAGVGWKGQPAAPSCQEGQLQGFRLGQYLRLPSCWVENGLGVGKSEAGNPPAGT